MGELELFLMALSKIGNFLLIVFSFILLVFPVVIVHEYGHYLVGKLLGAKPKIFSIGFGKTIFSIKTKQTLWKIGWIPLGGFVMFTHKQFEFEDLEQKEQIITGAGIELDEKPKVLSPWRWVFISLAGPLANFAFTFVILTSLITWAFSSITFYEVNKNHETLVKGDRVVAIGDGLVKNLPMVKRMFFGEAEGNILKIPKGMSPEALEITEGEVQNIATVKTTTFLEDLKKSSGYSVYLLGVMMKATTEGLLGLVTKPQEGYKGIMGPMGIASEAENARSKGFINFILFMALISFAIGFFNLIPLFILDGGRCLVAVVETVIMRPLNRRVLDLYASLSLLSIFLLLMVAMFADTLRLFFS